MEALPLAFRASVPDDPKLLVEFGLARLASDEGFAIFGAFDDTRLVGIVGVCRETVKKDRLKSFIWGMYVSERSRRRSAGDMLLRAAIDKARSWPGVEAVRLSVSEVASDGRRMYEWHSSRDWGREPLTLCWEGRSAAETHMTLDLRETGVA